jgi:hypothetical protein
LPPDKSGTFPPSYRLVNLRGFAMEQHGAVPGIAAVSVRRALRLVLLLGGSVALWWALATGTAQADDHGADDHGADDHGTAAGPLGTATDPAATAVGGVTDQVRHAARSATEEVRRTTSRTGDAVRDAGHAASPVRTVVEPVTDAVGDTLDRTADSVGRAATAVDVAVADTVDTVDHQVGSATHLLDTALPAASPRRGEATPHAGHRHRAAAVPMGSVAAPAPHRLLASRLSTGVPAAVSATALTAGFAPSVNPGVATVDPSAADVPSQPGPAAPDPAVPTSSLSPSPSFVAMLGALILGVPLLLQRQPRAPAFALPPAPALLPGCSPD